MAVELNERFENRKNKKAAFVVRHDEKAKTVILQYEEDGKTVGPMTYSTLSKSWKKLVAEPEEVVEEVKEESTEEVAGDGTPYAEVMGEIVVGAEEKAKEKKKEKKEKAPKQKKEKVEKPKKEKAPAIDTIGIAVAFLGDKCKYSGKYIGVKNADKKTIMSIYRRRTAIRIYTNDETFEKVKAYTDLYELKGPGASKLNISMYVNAENIEKVLDIMMKED